jgi:hypothetical protein
LCKRENRNERKIRERESKTRERDKEKDRDREKEQVKAEPGGKYKIHTCKQIKNNNTKNTLSG